MPLLEKKYLLCRLKMSFDPRDSSNVVFLPSLYLKIEAAADNR